MRSQSASYHGYRFLPDIISHVELFDEVVDDRSLCLRTSGQKRDAERETEQEGDDQRSASADFTCT